jgi:hypothetical protein
MPPATPVTTAPELKAAYTVPELAAMAGLSRFQVYRLIKRHSVTLVDELVPLISFRTCFPDLWESIVLKSHVQAGFVN